MSFVLYDVKEKIRLIDRFMERLFEILKLYLSERYVKPYNTFNA